MAGFLEELLGTRTKIRIIKTLINEGTPLTRNKLANQTGAGIGPVYDQVDQLIATGILKEEKRKITLDLDFPYLDPLRDLILLTEDHMNDPGTLFRTLDRILGDDYYISGYVSACQNGPPMDVEEKTVLIMVKGMDARKDRMVNTIAKCTEYHLKWEPTNWIPIDVQRRTVHGADVWISSLERGMVDSIKSGECGYYPIFLLLVQNIVNGSVDVKTLTDLSDENETAMIFKGALSIIDGRIPSFELPEGLLVSPDKEVSSTVEMALNTVLGG